MIFEPDTIVITESENGQRQEKISKKAKLSEHSLSVRFHEKAVNFDVT